MKQEIDIKKLAESTAYHEASHFVLALLINKLNKPSGITISVEWGKPYDNKVIAQVSPEDDSSSIFGNCFILLSGHYSYKVFIEQNTDYFFRDILPTSDGCIILTEKSVLKPTGLYERLRKIDEYIRNEDIVRTVNFLEKLCENNMSYSTPLGKIKLHDMISFLQDQLHKIMCKKHVKDAIELVKEKLLKNNGKLIENGDLDELTLKTEKLIKNVDVVEYLDACTTAYENNEWGIEANFTIIKSD